MTIDFELKNCYGIGSFKETLNFYDDKPIVIHASNGVMKTSFTKTIRDLIQGKSSNDILNQLKTSTRNILINGVEATSSSFYVFDEPNERKLDAYVSGALMNPKLRDEYNNSLIAERRKLELFFKKYASLTGQKDYELEEYFLQRAGTNDIFSALKKYKNRMLKTKKILITHLNIMMFLKLK